MNWPASHLRTRVADLADPVVLHDADGPVGLYGIPYLLPDAVMAELDAGRSHAAVLGAAATRIRADASRRGVDRTVVAAHAFVTGARPSESERDICVGGIGDAPAAVFDGITYTALGHLHGPQRLTDRVGYSGSPLAFSFSEVGHTKSVSIVQIDGAGGIEVEAVPVPVHRGLAEVRGRLEDLLARARTDLLGVADRLGEGGAHRPATAACADGTPARGMAAHARARLPAGGRRHRRRRRP